MNLRELKTYVDHTINHLPYYEIPDDVEVMITLSEPSIGARASAKVKFAGMGFDWEHGQFRIEPDRPIVSKGNTHQDVKQARIENIDGRNYYFCPRCEERISKNDKFCRNCSQKLR